MDARSSGYGRARTAVNAPEQPHATRRKPSLTVRLARRIDGLGRSSATDPGDPVLVRRATLFVYTGASIVVGLSLLVWTTLVIPIGSLIDPGLADTALAGKPGGVPRYALPGRANAPLPYLCYSPNAYMARMADLILENASKRAYLQKTYETDMAESLKARLKL